MKRDGQKISVWQDTVQAIPYPKGQGLYYDVIIIGCGITGLSAALRLQKKGKRCLILDAHTVGFGTTGGTSAHLNAVLDTPYSEIINKHGREKAMLVAQSTREAIAEIVRNIHDYQISCDYMPYDGFMYAQTEEEGEELDKIKDAIIAVGLHASDVTSIPVPFDIAKAITFGGQASFHPTKYIMGLLQAYVNLGGHIQEYALVQDVTETQEDKLEVKTAEGQMWVAQTVVYATHTPPGIQLMNFRLAPYRSYIQVFELENESHCPDGLVYDMQDPFHYFRTVFIADKPYLMVGGQDHKTAHHENEKFNFLELEAFVNKHYAVKQKGYEWSSQYYESQDSLPFIGVYPGKRHQREFIATGFGGNGMIFGTLSSIILADLIIEGENQYKELYSPGRFGPLSAIGDLLVENIDVVKHFIKDRFGLEKIESIAEIGNDEGRILEYQGDTIGIYKDPVGKLFLIDPVCRHAGCIVKWNNAEHSWDCPCHGARYAANGDLLNGPAVAALRKW